MKGIIIQNSLSDTSILDKLHILKTKVGNTWTLHDIIANKDDIPLLQHALATGPWYIHLWNEDEIVVIYKDKIFWIDKNDHASWREAIKHGLTIGIPIEQLSFVTN